jgi:acetyl esterase/lipase
MPSRQTWLRAGLTVAAIALLAPVTPVVLSGYLPNVGALASVSRLVVPWLQWLLLVAALASALALLAVRVDGRALQNVLAALALVTLAGAVLMTGRVAAVGLSSQASISWTRAAGLGGEPMPTADDDVVYATVGGQPLHAQIWRTPGVADTVAMFIHGGSFTGGGLGGRPWLFRAWADQGMAVVDVEYRLAPPPRWDQAPGDVVCALAWVEAHAQELDGGKASASSTNVVVIGDSAGGNLALMAGYGAGRLLTSSCNENPSPPAGVIAIEPVADLAAIWADHSVPGDPVGGPFPESYIGGPPSQFPDRYDQASPMRLMDMDLTPTLLIAAENDHLVLPARTSQLAQRINVAGIQCSLVVVPYAEHGVAAGPDDFGEQLEEGIVPAWIRWHRANPLASNSKPFGQVCG